MVYVYLYCILPLDLHNVSSHLRTCRLYLYRMYYLIWEPVLHSTGCTVSFVYLSCILPDVQCHLCTCPVFYWVLCLSFVPVLHSTGFNVSALYLYCILADVMSQLCICTAFWRM